jgi:hypothetical protein
MKSGSLNLLEPSEPVQGLLFPFYEILALIATTVHILFLSLVKENA